MSITSTLKIITSENVTNQIGAKFWSCTDVGYDTTACHISDSRFYKSKETNQLATVSLQQQLDFVVRYFTQIIIAIYVSFVKLTLIYRLITKKNSLLCFRRSLLCFRRSRRKTMCGVRSLFMIK